MKQNCCIPISTMSSIREVNAERMNSYYMDQGLEPQGYEFELSDIDTTLLPETIEKGKSNYLKLPLYRQSHNFTCGVACVMSILRYAGYEFDTREDRLLWKLGSTPEAGTNYETIREYLESVRYENSSADVIVTTVHECDYDSKCSNETDVEKLLTEFRNAIDNDSPVICAIQAWKDDGDYASRTEDDGHYVVLIGYKEYSEGYIYYFMDPSTAGNYTYLTEKEFILRWHDEVNKKSKRIGIEVKYKNLKTEFSGDVAYHLE